MSQGEGEKEWMRRSGREKGKGVEGSKRVKEREKVMEIYKGNEREIKRKKLREKNRGNVREEKKKA